MYLDITDRNTFVFLRKLKPFFTKLQPYSKNFILFLVKLNINYATIPCKNCLDGDCFYDKSYCKKIIYGWVPNAGQIFIK